MLSASLNITIESKLKDLEFAVQFIDCEYRRQIMYTTVYHKLSPAIKLLPVDMNWVVKPEYDGCVAALMSLSAILNFLNLHKTVFVHEDERQCIALLRDIYNSLKEGLREHGCISPPYKTGTHLLAADVLSSSRIINERFQRDFRQNRDICD
jgi:hypothetical protein